MGHGSKRNKHEINIIRSKKFSYRRHGKQRKKNNTKNKF